MNKAINKEIVVLSEKEHIRARPTVYVGSVKPTDEKIPIIRNGRIFTVEEIKKLKKVLKLVVISELYGGVLYQKTLQIKFDA
jgi:DNA gyrase/topoisomerase IV subunit B